MVRKEIWWPWGERIQIRENQINETAEVSIDLRATGWGKIFIIEKRKAQNVEKLEWGWVQADF